MEVEQNHYKISFMKKFEYKIVSLVMDLSGLKAQKQLDDLGNDGWELIGMYPYDSTRATSLSGVFKREIK